MPAESPAAPVGPAEPAAAAAVGGGAAAAERPAAPPAPRYGSLQLPSTAAVCFPIAEAEDQRALSSVTQSATSGCRDFNNWVGTVQRRSSVLILCDIVPLSLMKTKSLRQTVASPHFKNGNCSHSDCTQEQ